MDTTPIEIVADRLAWLLKSWSSIEWRVRLDYKNVNFTESGGAHLYSAYTEFGHYVETAAGLRLSEEELQLADSNTGSINRYYCDGKRCSHLYRKREQAPDEGQVRINRFFGNEETGHSHRPEPFQSFYFGLRSLDKAIREAESLGEGVHASRPCDLFLLRKETDGGSVVYFLDRETSVPLKVVHYATEADRQADRVLFEWSGKAIERREGYPIVPASELVHYRHEPNGSRVVLYHCHYNVEDFRLNQPQDPAQFWPVITPKMNVLDMVNRKAHFPKRSETSKQITQDAGSRLIPEERSIPQGAIFVGLGFAMIAVAGWLWWRRRA
ncbi:MAG: hypothetical protein U0800_15930 [Isosphaeraceae bacterium]